MKPIRIGLIGCGEIAQIMHLPYLNELPQFELVAISDLSPSVLNAVGNRYGVTIRSTDYKDILSEVDAVAVVTHDHAEIVQTAASERKDIFVEKPLSFSLEECDAVLDAARENDVVLMVGYMKRYDPAYLYALDAVGSMDGITFARIHDFGGSFGVHPDVYTLHRPDDLSDTLLQSGHAKIRETMRVALGGSPSEQLVDIYFEMLMSGSHDLTVLRGMFGQARDVLSSHPLGQGGLISVLDYGEGRTCSFEISLMTDHLWWDQNLAVYGRDQAIALSFPNPFIKHAPAVVEVDLNEGAAPVRKVLHASYEEAFRREWLHFAECVRDRKEPVTTGADARADVELALAMVKAVQ